MGILKERMLIAEIPVEVRRNSRRRSRVGLSFDPAGLVVLDAPVDVTESELTALVEEHSRWLRHRLAKVREDAACVASPQHVSGELVQYLGDAYELKVSVGSKSVIRTQRPQIPLFSGSHGVSGEIRVILPSAEPARVRKLLNRWYSKQAKQAFAESFNRWIHLPWLNEQLPPWRFSFMRSQWGSCSASGEIALNSHLVKVPETLIDYVVLHELCHLKHHNHSRRFYGLMSAHMPDWDLRRQSLNLYLPVLLHD